MTQIHQALSHYWTLRDQGNAPAKAAAHVRQRFGVEINPETPLASTSALVPRQPFSVDDRIIDNDGDVATVNSTDEAGFNMRYDMALGAVRNMPFRASWSEIESMGYRVLMSAVKDDEPSGFGVKPKVYCCASPAGLMGTA